MRHLIFLSGIIALIASSAVEAKRTQTRTDVITLKTPGGDTKEIKTYGRASQNRKPNLPRVDIQKKQHLCRADRRSEIHMMDRMEMQLELENLISSLQKMEMPRGLSLTQKVMISQVPFCYPFITDLTVISKLLKGFDLVHIAKQ